MKVVLLTLLLGLVCAAQEEEAELSASKVPGMVWPGRRSCVCVCVCVCVCPFYGFVIWIFKPIHLPSTQHCSVNSLYTCSLWRLYHLNYVLIDSDAFFLLL